jgi:DNA-binding GntR family transcriptional regulator
MYAINKDLQVMKKMTSAGLPTHEMTYRALKELLLFGEIAPGQAVTIQGLVVRLEVGMTPVREALRRLISEGALEFQGNRRVSVPVLTPENLSELKFARAAVERELTLKACYNINEHGLKQLEKLDASLDSAIARGDVGAYLRHNYGFHKTLYSYAQASILESLADNLWLRYGPSLRVVCGRVGTQNLVDHHKQAITAVRGGQVEDAAEAMAADVNEGIDYVIAEFSS